EAQFERQVLCAPVRFLELVANVAVFVVIKVGQSLGQLDLRFLVSRLRQLLRAFGDVVEIECKGRNAGKESERKNQGARMKPYQFKNIHEHDFQSKASPAACRR